MARTQNEQRSERGALKAYNSVCLLCLLLAAGCAVQGARRAAPAPVSAAQTAPAQHCPDRIDRAKAGGTVGTVVGTVVASALGSPFLGILYQVGGYAAGFSSAAPCRNQNPAVAAAQSRSDAPPVPSGKIVEEDIK